MPPNLFNWRPIARQTPALASVAVVSSDDPYCAPPRQAMAQAWGSELLEIGARGHINGESGLGDWPEGIACWSAWEGARADRGQSRPMVTKETQGPRALGWKRCSAPKVSDTPALPPTPRPPSSSSMRCARQVPAAHPRTRARCTNWPSIKAQGVMQPSAGAPVAPGRYEIIAGERAARRQAGRAGRGAGARQERARRSGRGDVAHREHPARGLNPLEEAQGLQAPDRRVRPDARAGRAGRGRSRSAASNLLRLLNLSEPVQQMLMAGDIDMGHARALLPLEGAQQILAAGDVVAQAERARGREARHASCSISASSRLRRQERKSRDVARWRKNCRMR